MKPKTISTEKIFEGKIISVQIDDILLENGKPAKREVVRHEAAACIFAYDKEGYGYLVEQYRHAVGEYMVEAVAGLCDEGEEPKETAKRELNEEINALCDNLDYLGEFYPTPGFCDETIHLYSAEITGFKQGTPDEDEFIQIKKLPLEAIYSMIDNNEIKDGKTIAAVLKFRIKNQ